jgi:hypothetical protein
VHAALAYYRDHRDDIERAIADERALSDELRRHIPGPLQAKLSQRGSG